MKIQIVMLFFVIFNLNAQKSDLYYKNIESYEGLSSLSKFGEIGALLDKTSSAETRDEKIRYLDNALHLSREKKDSTLLPYIYYKYAAFNIDFNDQVAISYFNKILAITQWNNLNYLRSVVYIRLAIINQEINNFDKSIVYYEEVIKQSQFIQLKNMCKTNILIMHVDNGKLELAKIYIDELLEFQKDNKVNGLGNSTLSMLYLYSSKLKKTLSEKLITINKSIALNLEDDSEFFNLSAAYYYRALIYIDFNKNNLAINDLHTSLKIMKDNSNYFHSLKGNVYNKLAYIALEENLASKAIVYADSSNMLMKKNQIDIKKSNDSIFYKSYAILGNYKKAYNYSEKYILSQDSLMASRKDSLYIAYGKKYQTEKKIQENELLKKDNVIKDLEVKKQTTNRNYLLLFSALGLITLGVTYNRFRLKRKTANALATQNSIINNQKAELEKSNANKQKLFGIVAHDLVNPFNAILGYTKLLEEDYDDFSELERKKFINIINKYANSNYNLTRTLLDWAKVQQDQLVVEKATLNCKTIVSEAILPYQVLADKKEIHITTSIPDHTFIQADKNMMQTVIGNLFVNAIKFTPQKGEINFHLEKNKEGTVKIEIEDNGIGMSQEQLNNLFDITKVQSAKGTNNEKGNGLGLILCKELMELQKGTLSLISEKDKGSTAILSI